MGTELTYKDQIIQELEKNRLALPEGTNELRMATNFIALMNGNETLQDFVKKFPSGWAQIKQGMIQLAIQGLDAYAGEGYLIPYKDKLQVLPSHRGAVKMAKRYCTKPIKDIYSKVVREGDNVSIEIVNGEQKLNFKPLPFNDGKIVGAFAVCLYEDGTMIYELMSLKELEVCRSSSKARNSPAWSRFTSEMYRKTVLHRLTKQIPIDMDASAWDLFNSGNEIVTDIKEEVQMEIEDNANQEEFEADFEVIN